MRARIDQKSNVFVLQSVGPLLSLQNPPRLMFVKGGNTTPTLLKQLFKPDAISRCSMTEVPARSDICSNA